MRDLSLFYKLFLIDASARQAVQLCPFVRPGLMHNDFQPYVRSDGLGIDYSHLLQYDTKYVLNVGKENGKLRPYWERLIQTAMDAQDSEQLKVLVKDAQESGLDKRNVPLITKATELLKIW